jgi:DNA excision repair protein ERCC-4
MDDEADDEVLASIESLQKGLLTFQQDATEELLKHDGLSVFGQGLGMCTVAAALLAVHHHSCQGAGSGGAVIMIGMRLGRSFVDLVWLFACCNRMCVAGSTPAQKQHIASELRRLAPSASPISDVTATMFAPERIHLYSTAPILFITTRILAVDLLTARLQHSKVAGIIVLNAHRASDDSGEGFAVRLLRAKTKAAFVRGLTDEAGQLSVGLSTMEHSMRALLVSRVFFWPRFQDTVQQDLGHVDVRQQDVQ